MTAISRTYIRNESDTRRKQKFVRDMGKNPEQALLIANAIEKDDTLLMGLAAVVADVAKHPACQKILEEVFKRPNVKKRYKAAFEAFNDARKAAYREFVENALFG